MKTLRILRITSQLNGNYFKTQNCCYIKQKKQKMTDVPIKWQLLQDAELLLHKIKKRKKMTDKHRLIFRKIHPTKQFHFNNLENFRNTKMPKTFLVTPCSEESTPANDEGNCEALRLNSLGNNGRVNVRFLAITFRTTTVSISSRPHLPKVVGR